MTEAGKQALLAIAHNTRQIPDENWSFNYTLARKRVKSFSFECKTVGCAIGHGIDLPEVRATGLRLARCDWRRNDMMPVYNGKCRGTAIGRAFGISRQDAEYLFYSHYYLGNPSQEEVAQRIETYVLDHDDLKMPIVCGDELKVNV